MDHELENKLTSWWLNIAPSRQEELLMDSPPAMPWLDESLANEGLHLADVGSFLESKRAEHAVTRDAGLNPRPD